MEPPQPSMGRQPPGRATSIESTSAKARVASLVIRTPLDRPVPRPELLRQAAARRDLHRAAARRDLHRAAARRDLHRAAAVRVLHRAAALRDLHRAAAVRGLHRAAALRDLHRAAALRAARRRMVMRRARLLQAGMHQATRPRLVLNQADSLLRAVREQPGRREATTDECATLWKCQMSPVSGVARAARSR
jgi:hypothetical protein